MFAKRIITVTAAAALLLAASAASAQNVVGSKHDMTSGTQSANFDNVLNTGGQVCVFCHTPHNATASTNGPIWNRANVASEYTMYGTTRGGTTPAGTPGPESMACLSCHDGSVAIDSISNTPNPSNSWESNGAVIEGYALVGTNLSDDHPVSLTYTEARGGLVASGTATGLGIELYGTNSDQVECASCHNVHDNTLAPFLRVTANNSDICTACHDR